ncbi:unnamed protein product [Phytophthora fragariaefolia]|uniref:Unnamed protein product n=1 Tax=Phytophthora fragariaefolia TaxID=1490495 RepID=A0A9W7DA99_9STRA|nr:unnamed protein product [Phytophthora fragariaefolia]
MSAATAATPPLAEEAEADYVPPRVFGSMAKLPDGRKIDIRTCFDARGVNVSLVAVDKHPLPLVKETHASFKGKRFVSALDPKWSFHQFMVALCDRPKLSFTWECSGLT